MKILYPNLAKLVGAGPPETDPNFPVSNLADEHLLKVWKVLETNQANQVELNYHAPGMADCIALFGLDLEAVTLEVYSDEAKSQLVKSAKVVCQGSDVFGVKKQEQLWWEFPAITDGYFKLIVHTETIKSPQIGMVCIGQVRSFPNPSWGFRQGFSNHSVKKPLKNGSAFTRAKVIARNPQGNLQLPMTNGGRAQYYSLLHLYKRLNLGCFACLMIEGLTDDQGASLDQEYAIWASFGQSFNPTEAKYSVYTIEFSLEEGL